MLKMPKISSLKSGGKKALIIYLCWCAVKGLAFLIAGWLLR